MSLDLIVEHVAQRSTGVKTFVLRHPEGIDLPPFEAGAHVKLTVHLPTGREISRSYSIANGEFQRDYYELGILRNTMGSSVSAWLHDSLTPGASVVVSLPVNNFPLVKGAEKHILIAGGIGITPLLSMARTLEHRGVPFELYYFGKDEGSLAFLPEVRSLARRKGFEYFSSDPGEVRQQLDAILAAPSPERHAYVCGPTGMIQTALTSAEQRGWAPNNMHYEQFSEGVVGLHNAPFKAILLQSGKTLEVRGDQTLLDALLEAGVDAPFDCRSGICGSCMVPASGGGIDHRDSYLSMEERAANDLICTCVSRAASGEIQLEI